MKYISLKNGWLFHLKVYSSIHVKVTIQFSTSCQGKLWWQGRPLSSMPEVAQPFSSPYSDSLLTQKTMTQFMECIVFLECRILDEGTDWSSLDVEPLLDVQSLMKIWSPLSVQSLLDVKSSLDVQWLLNVESSLDVYSSLKVFQNVESSLDVVLAGCTVFAQCKVFAGCTVLTDMQSPFNVQSSLNIQSWMNVVFAECIVHW